MVDNQTKTNKERAIADALKAQDVWKLRELALGPGGLRNGTLFLPGKK